MIKERIIWLPIDGEMEEVHVTFTDRVVRMKTVRFPVYSQDADFEKAASTIIAYANDYLGVNDDRSN